jgi:guanine deaminase
MGDALVVRGTVYQAPTPHSLEVLEDVVVAVNALGVIRAVHAADSADGRDAISGALHLVELSSSQRLLPGLIDTHIHAPQWPQLGTGLDIPLDKWLFEYTFPLEARYADAGFADDVWNRMVPTLLRHGTTTAVYYGTVHNEATARLASACVRYGQRAFVGRVGMDHEQGTPEWYRDSSASAGLAASAQSIDEIRAIDAGAGLVQPIITPRFAPACSDELLNGLGDLAASSGVLVQTHCSESDWEHGYAFERFGVSDTVALQRFGLIRDHSVLAHGDHLGDSDLAILAAVGAGVAHCPLSNAYFANAVFPLRRALANGVRVGLGSDVAGGAHPGLLPQCGHAVTASRYLEDGVHAGLAADIRGVTESRVDAVTAFYVATAGGADLVGINSGVLKPGNVFDAIVVDTDSRMSGLHFYEDIDNHERLFEKIVRLAGPEDFTSVWVDGQRVA